MSWILQNNDFYGHTDSEEHCHILAMRDFFEEHGTKDKEQKYLQDEKIPFRVLDVSLVYDRYARMVIKTSMSSKKLCIDVQENTARVYSEYPPTIVNFIYDKVFRHYLYYQINKYYNKKENYECLY